MWINYVPFGTLVAEVAKLTFYATLLNVLVTCIYRLIFHPLAKYPGPVMARISDIYGAYYNARGDGYLMIRRLHQKYGPVVRMGPNKLVFEDPQAFQEIYTTKKVQKAKAYEAMNATPGVYNIHNCIDKQQHRRKRKAVAPAFSDQALRRFEPVIINHIDTMLDQLRLAANESHDSHWSKPLNISDYFQFLTFDIMGSFGFGQSFRTLTDPSQRSLLSGMKTNTILAGLYAQYPRLKNFKIHKFFSYKGKGTQKNFIQTVRRIGETRMAESREAKTDLYCFMMDSATMDSSPMLAIDEILSESRLYLHAGTDTTASALSAITFYLSRYPKCYDKLASEIREAFNGTDIRSGPALAGCSYLRAVIDESMRMSPPLGAALWREVVEQGVTIGGEVIPPGTDVGSSVYVTCRNANIYEDPDTFNPERWLSYYESTKEERQLASSAFNPFSVGSRSCIGQGMALLEMKLTTANLMWHFDFRKPSGPEALVGRVEEQASRGIEEYFTNEHNSPLPDGPYVELRPRR